MNFRVAVTGGANIDIGGRANAPLVERDSNPGQVRTTPGGVARNIAENARLMGMEVELISAFGYDANGRLLVNDLHAKGVGTAASIITKEARTSAYVYIADADGDMRLAINDMEIVNLLTPEYFASWIDILNGSDAIVLDANLPAESIEYLAENVRVPIFADAVSAVKAERLRGAIPKLYCLKLNRLEAQVLTGMEIATPEDAIAAAKALTAQGLQRAYITLGADGAVCAEGEKARLLPAYGCEPCDATGAGDAFTAGLVLAHAENRNYVIAGRTALAAASIAIAAETAVNVEMSVDRIHEKMLETEE